MGRIMSFDQDGRRVRDFDKSEHDFLRRYGRTPEEVMDENAKLRNILAHAVMLVDLYEGLTNTRLSLDGGIVDCDWLRAWCKKLGIEVPS